MPEFIKMLAGYRVPVKLYNPAYETYLFVSNDTKAGDHVVEAHGAVNVGEQRNAFILEDCGNDRYRLFNQSYGKWVFVSNDKEGSDHVVEAHGVKEEARNQFEVQFVGENRFRLFNPSYGEYVFVSNDKDGPDYVVEAHPNASEERNIFSLVLPDPVTYTLKDVNYVISVVPEDEPCGELQAIDLNNSSDSEATLTATVTHTYTHTQSWSNQAGVRVGVKTTFETGVPYILGGKIEVSVEATFSRTWGETTTETRTFSQQISVKVPPHSHVVCKCRLWVKKLDIPYTGTLVVHYSGPFGEGDYEEQVIGNYVGVEASIMKVEVSEPKDSPEPKHVIHAGTGTHKIHGVPG